MNVDDYVIWYEELQDGTIMRRNGRALSVRPDTVTVKVRRSLLVEVLSANIAASAPTLAELDHKLQELRETCPAEQRIREQFEARYGRPSVPQSGTGEGT